jgi:hypothetical protein
MKYTISITLTLAIAFGLVLASTGLHSMSVFAQTNATKKSTSAAGTNATKASEASAGKSTAQKPSANKSSGGKSTTPTSTVATVKGGPKAAGTASQLSQVEGNNTNIISKGANIANKPGIAGLSKESNTTGK